MTEHFLSVSEQFYSIQGESSWAGLPCLFLRLSGCNLRCNYCDSSYTWEEEGKKTSLQQILNWVCDYPGTMVELTGGEPLLQEAVYPLIQALLEHEHTVLIETNGSVSVERVAPEAHIILDIKCPGSGMEHSVNWENLGYLRSRSRIGCHDEIKFVLSSPEDFYWAKKIINQYDIHEIAPVLFSPNEERFAARELAELILQHKMKARLQLQLHRVIWPGTFRGV